MTIFAIITKTIMSYVKRINVPTRTIGSSRHAYQIYENDESTKIIGSLNCSEYDSAVKHIKQWSIEEFSTQLLDLIKQHNERFVILRALLIDKTHKRKGFGRELVNAVKQDFTRSLIILVAEPFDHKALRKQELIKWYATQGFVSLSDTQSKHHYMVCETVTE